MKNQIYKDIPSFRNDKQAEDFIANADLTEYDLSTFTPVRFEFEAKSSSINMRLPESLLSAVKAKAKAEGIPYTRYIRLLLEEAVSH